MPFIHVRLLPLAAEADVPTVMKDMCENAAKAVGVPASKVWASWEFLPAGQMVEGREPSMIQPKATHPPHVTVTLFEGRTREMKAALLESIARTLCAGLGLAPGNVFIALHEVRSGEIYVGGRVKTT